ncbi:hypothetical protein TNCV_3651411 [Trichonephila clavipes]|nr:hypothetical protein TNCV_3651411 [Trichonephila clavipes]
MRVSEVLSQEIDGQGTSRSLLGKCLSKPERNYCVTRKRATGYYLYGQEILKARCLNELHIRHRTPRMEMLMPFQEDHAPENCRPE